MLMADFFSIFTYTVDNSSSSTDCQPGQAQNSKESEQLRAALYFTACCTQGTRFVGQGSVTDIAMDITAVTFQRQRSPALLRTNKL